MATVALVGVTGEGLFDRVHTGAPGVERSDSQYVRLQAEAAVPDNVGPFISGLFQNVDIADPAQARLIGDEVARLATVDNVRYVVWPLGFELGAGVDASAFDGGGGDPRDLVSSSGNGFLLQIHMSAFDNEDEALASHRAIEARLDELTQRLRDVVSSEDSMTSPSSLTYSTPLLINDFGAQIERDLVTGETYALPLALIVMVLVFGGFLAASTPLIGALASIAGGLLVLYGFSYPITMDDSAINVVTVLGIGLSVDYGLLIVSRYREELDKRSLTDSWTREEALEATLNTAGRTVFFSAITVGIAVGGMITFEPAILRGFGSAALGVVAMALLTALTLVPALAYIWAHTIAKRGVLFSVPGLRRLVRSTSDVKRDYGTFSRLATRVQRHPLLILASASALLLVLASPLLGLQMRNSQAELLPTSNERRQFLDTFEVEYALLVEPGIAVLADTDPATLDAWMMANVAGINGVRDVAQATNQRGKAVAGIYLHATDGGSAEAVSVVNGVRALDAPFRVYLGGQAANQVDFIEAIERGAPVAISIVVLATFVLLFLMTGSLLVPLKALLINTLSLAATLGALTWVFQYGNLERLLGFDSAGGLETYVVVLVVAFGFGLAMDYDLFLLSRVQELVRRGVPNDEAVRIGLQRSGRIITSAAAVIVLVFLGFAFGQLLVIKQVGFGLAFAVLLDATVVRMLLAPSTMTLLGTYNWWAPGPLRRLHERFAINH
jgi:RND superfamily putative drug exporter